MKLHNYIPAPLTAVERCDAVERYREADLLTVNHGYPDCLYTPKKDFFHASIGITEMSTNQIKKRKPKQQMIR